MTARGRAPSARGLRQALAAAELGGLSKREALKNVGFAADSGHASR